MQNHLSRNIPSKKQNTDAAQNAAQQGIKNAVTNVAKQSGMTAEEAAKILNVNARTITRDELLKVGFLF